MSTVRGQQHSVSTHERMLLWKCQRFETEYILTWGGLESPTFGSMPNALTIWAIRARYLLSCVFEYWLWRTQYFKVKSTFVMLTARATAFIFDTRTDILVEVSKFLRQEMFRPEGHSTSRPSYSEYIPWCNYEHISSTTSVLFQAKCLFSFYRKQHPFLHVQFLHVCRWIVYQCNRR